MSPTPEHLAIAFANTLSSRQRDHIATFEQFKGWAAEWPPLSRLAARMPAGALAPIRVQRDATQQVLHRLAASEPVPTETLDLVTRPGLAAAPFQLLADANGIAVDGEPSAAIRHLLSRAVIDFMLGSQAARLRRCAGSGCQKVFLAHRLDRRWCDSRICGNRTRVAAHARRRAETPAPAL